MDILIVLLIGLIAFFIVFIILSLFQEVASEKVQMEDKDAEIESFLLRMIAPLGRAIGGALSPMFRNVEQTIFFQEKRQFSLTEYFFRMTSAWRNRIQKLLIGSGMYDFFDPLEIIGLQFVGAFIGLVIGVYFYAVIHTASLIPGLAFLGFFFPMISLSEKAQQRKLDMQISLPYVLDLLTLAVEAGIDFTQALQRIVDRGTKNPLIDEFSRMLQQIQVGKPRTEALREFAERTDIEDVRSIVQALIQADELGSPLGPILRVQAEQLRVKRSQRAEKLAQQAPVKMLFPLIGCIFPTVFIILFGPIAIKVYNQFWG
ncbi:MAG: type II secretion system F family protein, partial [Planctomycetota bacterium]